MKAKVRSEPQLSLTQISTTGFLYRDRIRQQLVEILRGHWSDQKWAYECALRIEDEVYRLFKAGKLYCDRCRSILYNLQDENNKRPQDLLLKKEVSPEDFVNMDMREIAS